MEDHGIQHHTRTLPLVHPAAQDRTSHRSFRADNAEDPVNLMIYDLRTALDSGSMWPEISIVVSRKFRSRGHILPNACCRRFNLTAEKIAVARAEPYAREWYDGHRRTITKGNVQAHKRRVDYAKWHYHSKSASRKAGRSVEGSAKSCRDRTWTMATTARTAPKAAHPD